MFILANLLVALAHIVNVVFTALYWVILIRVLISWVNPDPLNPIVQFLYQVTEPILEPIRRVLPVLPIDLSPLVAFAVIYVLESFLASTLMEIAARLRQVNF